MKFRDNNFESLSAYFPWSSQIADCAWHFTQFSETSSNSRIESISSYLLTITKTFACWLQEIFDLIHSNSCENAFLSPGRRISTLSCTTSLQWPEWLFCISCIYSETETKSTFRLLSSISFHFSQRNRFHFRLTITNHQANGIVDGASLRYCEFDFVISRCILIMRHWCKQAVIMEWLAWTILEEGWS